MYVSLPRFKTTNQLKGFAFIEFGAKEEAKKAVEVFAEIDLMNLFDTMPLSYKA